jgi:hypothetical protein
MLYTKERVYWKYSKEKIWPAEEVIYVVVYAMGLTRETEEAMYRSLESKPFLIAGFLCQHFLCVVLWCLTKLPRSSLAS